MFEHRTKYNKGFTKKYGVDKLLHFEETDDIGAAIHREKQLKRWNRKWKLDLIERHNPNWKDLSEGWFGRVSGSSDQVGR